MTARASDEIREPKDTSSRAGLAHELVLLISSIRVGGVIMSAGDSKRLLAANLEDHLDRLTMRANAEPTDLSSLSVEVKTTIEEVITHIVQLETFILDLRQDPSVLATDAIVHLKCSMDALTLALHAVWKSWEEGQYEKEAAPIIEYAYDEVTEKYCDNLEFLARKMIIEEWKRSEEVEIIEYWQRDELVTLKNQIKFSPRQSALVAAIGRDHLGGGGLAGRTEYQFDGATKDALADLVRLGIFGNDSAGYYLEENYIYLLDGPESRQGQD